MLPAPPHAAPPTPPTRACVRYISRQLSFKSAEFETDIVDLTPKQQKMYDDAAKFWSELLGCMLYAKDDVLRTKSQKKHPSGRVMTHYWGCHQRFFRQL